MLPDSGHIQENDNYYFNKKRARQGLKPVEPLYTLDDARKCLELFIGVPYNRKFNIDNNIRVKFTNTGHMLGSGVISIEIRDKGDFVRIAYTGDIGRPENRILRPPDAFPQCDYLITEATYGDRLHPAMQDAEAELLRVVTETCADKKGKLIIPSFAIGRTQELVYTLNNYFNEGKLPRVKIYVDSPLAVNATDIFRLHTDTLNRDVQEVMENDPDPFGFSSLQYIKSADDSKKLNTLKEPCVIISASGMMEAGRIKHHLANNLSNPKNTVLAVGYCSPSTLGARILRGDPEVSIFGVIHEIKAKIERIEAFSGHGDYKEMISYLGCQSKEKIKKTFLVHGDADATTAYRSHLHDAGFDKVEIPVLKQVYNL